MKRYMNHLNRFAGVVAACVMMFLIISCEDNPSAVKKASAPPQLERVSLVHKDSTTTMGKRGVQYVILGKNLEATQSVSFNGVMGDLNPTLATRDNIIIRVPDNAPFRNAPDSLVVTNSAGSASLPFQIQQPPAKIDDFTPKAAGPGAIVTIAGTIFDGVEAVYFGDKEAEITSKSSTEIKVKVPEGVIQSKIRVVTPGGTTISEGSFGFKLIIYDDALFTSNGWYGGGYNSTQDYSNTEQVARGSNAIKVTLSGVYGALQMGTGDTGTPVDLSGYTAVKFSLYAEEGIGSLQVVLNSDYNNGVVINPTPGGYVNFTIPIADFGGPSQLTEFVIQGQGNVGTFYVDDLGLI